MGKRNIIVKWYDWIWFNWIISKDEFHPSLDIGFKDVEYMSDSKLHTKLSKLLKKRAKAHQLSKEYYDKRKS